MDPRISHLTSVEFIAHYLYRTKPVLEFSFMTLWVTQGEHSEAGLESHIRTYEQIPADDPEADYAQAWIRSLRDDLNFLRAERSTYGDSILHMAAAAVAASIISMAHQAIRLGKQHGDVPQGRMIHHPYRLQEFIKLSRDHGAHFWEDVTKASLERLEFQKIVLGYDQKADGTNINHSVALLEKLDWRSYNDIENDLFKLFDPASKKL